MCGSDLICALPHSDQAMAKKLLKGTKDVFGASEKECKHV